MTDVGEADFVTVNAGAGVAVTVADDAGDVTGVPAGAVPVAVAESLIDPASTSACVTVYEPVQVVEASGARVVAGQLTVTGPEGATWTSATDTPLTVTFPVFVTTKVYDTC